MIHSEKTYSLTIHKNTLAIHEACNNDSIWFENLTMKSSQYFECIIRLKNDLHFQNKNIDEESVSSILMILYHVDLLP